MAAEPSEPPAAEPQQGLAVESRWWDIVIGIIGIALVIGIIALAIGAITDDQQLATLQILLDWPVIIAVLGLALFIRLYGAIMVSRSGQWWNILIGLVALALVLAVTILVVKAIVEKEFSAVLLILTDWPVIVGVLGLALLIPLSEVLSQLMDDASPRTVFGALVALIILAWLTHLLIETISEGRSILILEILVSWPVAALLIGLALVAAFRRPLADLLDRARRTDNPD